jgi:hypothetical protein
MARLGHSDLPIGPPRLLAAVHEMVLAYPELEPDDIQQALAFAAANLEDSAGESHAA